MKMNRKLMLTNTIMVMSAFQVLCAREYTNINVFGYPSLPTGDDAKIKVVRTGSGTDCYAYTYETATQHVKKYLRNFDGKVSPKNQSIAGKVFIATAYYEWSTPPAHNIFPNIFDESFSGCAAMTEFACEANIKSIFSGMFQGCSSLTNFVMPTLKEIPDSAFSGCGSFVRFVVPDSVTNIGVNAFKDCTNMTELVVGQSVVNLSSNSFPSTSSLANLAFRGMPPAGLGMSGVLDSFPSVDFPSEHSNDWIVALSEFPADALVSISPEDGTLFSGDTSVSVSMQCLGEGYDIHYTLDGSEPTMDSPVYTRKFKIRPTERLTIKARVIIPNWPWNGTSTSTVAMGTCSNPTISLKDGTVFTSSDTLVSIAWDDSDGVLRYTVDGNEPTEDSPTYNGPFAISESTVVKAKVFGARYFDSQTVTSNLTREWLKVDTPVVTTSHTTFTGLLQQVSLSCATPRATIHYTLDGTPPNSESPVYSQPLIIKDTVSIRAYAIKEDCLDSDVAAIEITKVRHPGDAMNVPNREFSMEGTQDWVSDSSVTYDGVESLRSGTITHCQTSSLHTVVSGTGMLGFWWKTSCEEDIDGFYEWDHADFLVDGEIVAQIDGQPNEWRNVSKTLADDGEHILTWRYIKDDSESEGSDCVWVDSFSWVPDMIPVPGEAFRIPKGLDYSISAVH